MKNNTKSNLKSTVKSNNRASTVKGHAVTRTSKSSSGFSKINGLSGQFLSVKDDGKPFKSWTVKAPVKKQPLIDADGEVRELTAEDMVGFKPMLEVKPDLVKRLSAFNEQARATRGAQKSVLKKDVHIKLDADIVEFFKKDGRGWQTRLNASLRKVMDR